MTESWESIFLTFQEIAKLFSKWLYNFLFLWASYESSNSSIFSSFFFNSSIFSLTLGLARFFNFSCPHRCIVLFHWTFNLNFSNIYHLKYFVKYLFKSFVYSLGCCFVLCNELARTLYNPDTTLLSENVVVSTWLFLPFHFLNCVFWKKKRL